MLGPQKRNSTRSVTKRNTSQVCNTAAGHQSCHRCVRRVLRRVPASRGGCMGRAQESCAMVFAVAKKVVKNTRHPSAQIAAKLCRTTCPAVARIVGALARTNGRPSVSTTRFMRLSTPTTAACCTNSTLSSSVFAATCCKSRASSHAGTLVKSVAL